MTKRAKKIEVQVEETVIDQVNEEVVATTEVVLPSIEELRAQYGNKSAAIRALASMNVPRAKIAKHLNIRYQHVRNVLETELKRGPREMKKVEEVIEETNELDQIEIGQTEEGGEE